MVLGTDNDPFGLKSVRMPAQAGVSVQDMGWTWPFLSGFQFGSMPTALQSPDRVTASTMDAFRWDLINTYKNVPQFSDARILTLDPMTALALYYDQFQFTVNPDWRVGETGTRYINCPQYHLSESYGKPLRDAAQNPERAFYGKRFPQRAFVEWDGYAWSTKAYNPDKEPAGKTDRKALFEASFDLMQRIYALRTDLHWVTHPETGVRTQGLIPPWELRNAIPGCQREKGVADFVAPALLAIFSLIVPFGGWLALIPNTVQAIEDRRKLVDMVERLERLTTGAPAGIQALVNRRQLDRQWTPAAAAMQKPTDEEAMQLARKVGLHHPAMICAPDDPCLPVRQKELLHGLIDEWNGNRLNARRAGFENWRNTMLAGLTPGWLETDWSKKLSQARPFYTGDCRYDSGGVCAEGAAGFRAWAADVIPKLAPGPLPPAPRRNFTRNGSGPYVQSGPAYDRETLNRTDEILRTTGWFLATNEVETLLNAVAPPVPVTVANPPNMMNPGLNANIPAQSSKPVTPATAGLALAVIAILIST